MGNIASESVVMKARPVSDEPQAPFAPAPIDEVVARIKAEQPAMVFAPHVETASGMILPDDYIRAVADATHEVGGLFVLDCIASGTLWVDMKATGVDILISAPQKGWSASPCSGLVMLGEQARAKIEETTSSSFRLRPKKMAANYGGLRKRRPRLSRHHAHRCACLNSATPCWKPEITVLTKSVKNKLSLEY